MMKNDIDMDSDDDEECQEDGDSATGVEQCSPLLELFNNHVFGTNQYKLLMRQLLILRRETQSGMKC